MECRRIQPLLWLPSMNWWTMIPPWEEVVLCGIQADFLLKILMKQIDTYSLSFIRDTHLSSISSSTILIHKIQGLISWIEWSSLRKISSKIMNIILRTRITDIHQIAWFCPKCSLFILRVKFQTKMIKEKKFTKILFTKVKYQKESRISLMKMFISNSLI